MGVDYAVSIYIPPADERKFATVELYTSHPVHQTRTNGLYGQPGTKSDFV